MRWIVTVASVAWFGLFAAAPCWALSDVQPVGAKAGPMPSDAASGSTVGARFIEEAPAMQPVRRARTRILVRPSVAPPRHYHSIYPVPYRFDYPGPNAHRECSARYVQEHRPSGTVIVPRMNCRWVPGRYAGP
jgi:hypothetical protein